MARKGQALLQGIVRCGRCGALFHLHYSGRQGEWPEYRCSADQSQFGGTDCQRVRALALDRRIEQRFLEALQPDQVTLALAALAQLEQEEQAESKQWELRLERARYQAKRAERQYQAVEPEHRLVARSLEKQWEEQLRAVERRRKSTTPGSPVALELSHRQTEKLSWLWAAIYRRSGKRRPRPIRSANRCCA